jgi:hypothetical protein
MVIVLLLIASYLLSPSPLAATTLSDNFDNEAQTLFTPHLRSAVDAVGRQIELRACNIVRRCAARRGAERRRQLGLLR